MPYPPGHKDQTRIRIVQSARKLFNRHGFESVSIEQIMADAGLTVGGFYRHFESKSDLYAEALECFFTDPTWSRSWDGVCVDSTAADLGAQIIRAYLSPQHLAETDGACPMVTLPSDVARSGASARQAYERAFKAMVAALQRGPRGNGSHERRAALATAAMCVGGMVVARAIDDRGLADEFREAAVSGEAADISPQEGAAFSLFAGKIVGRNIELVPGVRIVHAWHPANWPPGVYSLVKFELRKHGTLTTVVLDHTGFPPGNFGHLDSGWRARYWDPLKKYLTEAPHPHDPRRGS
jgi:TetR/AcrR family transcriptional regulator, transcriptional repressor for nem operon